MAYAEENLFLSHRTASKYVNAAMERLKNVPNNDLEDRSYSVLEKLLVRSGNPNVAVSMALDMLLAGVDTVRIPARFCICLYMWR